MRVRFWGVRGALAATEACFQRVGGNTPCVEIRDQDNELLILDAGIGLYWLGRQLLTGPHGRGQGSVTLLFSHSHWDHIQGFPFFVPAFIPGNKVRVFGGGVDRLEDTLEGQMDPTYSPLVSLSNLGANVDIGALEDNPLLEVGQLRITHATFPNGPHQVVGYRIEEADKSVCYICEVDHPNEALRQQVVDLARGCDLLIHESFYTDAEVGAAPGLAGKLGPPPSGHSTFGQATSVALEAGVKRLLYFYHHPDRDDDAIDAAIKEQRARVAALGSALEVDTAREGTEFEI
ncbi:MAG: MBL fold metallo-hydrolase [Planctomycetes bacterium]|nr:MBL fold metallo-hydrolase [Planctomycetota bacterium]